MTIEQIREELVCIKQRLTAIETDISWFKTLWKLSLIGICTLLGLEISPYIME